MTIQVSFVTYIYYILISDLSNGFEGEIFGANMILASTIERNFTVKLNPLNGQKRFPKNKLKNTSKYTNYVILSDLLNEEIQNSFEKTSVPHGVSTKGFNNFHTRHRIEEITPTKKLRTKPTAASQEDLDLSISDFSTTNMEKIDFWNTAGNSKFTFAEVYNAQETRPTAANRVFPTVSEFETPPPPPPTPKNFHFYKTKGMQERTPKSIYNLGNNTTSSGRIIYNKLPVTELFDNELPPPEDKTTKVYGQWTSSRYAGNVLNYLKSINFKNREQLLKRVPQTIPLHKVLDSHPYPSDFKLNIVRPPSQFKNRKVVEKRYDIIRRNVHTLEDDLRLNIIKMHAEIQPKKVEITNRNSPKKGREHRFYRDAQTETDPREEVNSVEQHRPEPFILKEQRKKNHRYVGQPTSSKTRSTKLPFLKSLEYIMQNSENSEIQTDNQDTNIKNLLQGNKWHNAKSYSNDYTPHKINMDFSELLENQGKTQYPSLRLKYVPSKSKKTDLQEEEDPLISYARKLASQVSNQSFVPQDSVSLLKYNHGYLPEYSEWIKEKAKKEGDLRKRVQSKRNMKAVNFDQQVKIGNALNERIVIGSDEEQKKRSFVGGNEDIPDINKYGSELENMKATPLHGPRECKNVELYDRVLYVQPDESIDLTHILSPVREKNIAIEFIMQNYKKCSLTESSFQKNVMLLIDWSKTPVRLFGGAHPRTTTDLCGFF